MAKDFRIKQLRTSQVIVSGSNVGTSPSMLIYSASAASNISGGVVASLLGGVGNDAGSGKVGTDVWLFVSGSSASGVTAQNVLFGGNTIVSGSIETKSKLVINHADGGKINLQSADTTITANGVLGTIEFSASEEASGTDAILIAAAITAEAEGTFTSTNNATKLSFKTAFSESATEKMSLDSLGNLNVTGDVKVIGNNIKDGGGTSAITFDGSGNTKVDGTLTVPQHIIHDGDTDTGINFYDNKVAIETGATGEVVINDLSGNTDFRVETDNKSSAVHTIATQNAVKFLVNDQNDITQTDVNFLVGGTVNSRGTTTRGTALFTGDLVVSGTLYAERQILEVDFSQPSDLHLSGAVVLGDIGAAPDGGGQTRLSNALSNNSGSLFVSSGSLFVGIKKSGVYRETNITPSWSSAGNGLGEQNLSDTSKSFHLDINELTGSLTNSQIADGDLFAVADVNASNETKKITLANVATKLAGTGLVSAAGVIGLNIDGLGALGGTGLHQSQDHFAFSDNGTEKKITFSNLEDAIFANVSGDATVAAGGDISLGVAAITNQTAMTGDVADTDELVINDGGALKRVDFSVLRDAVYNDVAGDATVASGGVLTIADGAVHGPMLNTDVVSSQGEMTGDVADTDEILISDAGVVKRADFSVVRDAVFNDISGDATVADGGALTIQSTSVEGTMLNTNVADTSTLEVSSNTLSVLKVPNALTAGTGISAGGTFDGAAARTISVASAQTTIQSVTKDDFTTIGRAGAANDLIDFNTAGSVKFKTNNADRIIISDTSTTVSNDLLITGDIKHDADLDTNISFLDDRITLTAGNLNALDIIENGVGSAVVINEAGNVNLDFRVESNTQPKAIYVNSGLDYVSIGDDTAVAAYQDAHLFVSGTIGGIADGGATAQGVAVFGGDLVVSGTIYNAQHESISLASYKENGTFGAGTATSPSAAGTDSVAIGLRSSAAGNYSLAIGSSETNNTDATGNHSLAIGGDDATASGAYSAVIGGSVNTALGQYSVAMGRNSNVTGDYSVAIGDTLTTYDARTTIFGSSGSPASAKTLLSSSLEVNQTATFKSHVDVAEKIRHDGDADTYIKFETDRIHNYAGNIQMMDLRHQAVDNRYVKFMKQGNLQSGITEYEGTDIAFYVSGSTGTVNSNTVKGVSLFGGDVVVSGSINTPSNMSVSGELSFNAATIIKKDGSNNLTFNDANNTVKTLSQLATVGISDESTFFQGVHNGSNNAKMATSASVSFAGTQGSTYYPENVGSDVYLYVSGGLRSDTAAYGKTTTVFAGATVYSGSADYFGPVSFSSISAATITGTTSVTTPLIKDISGNTTAQIASQKISMGGAAAPDANSSTFAISKNSATQAGTSNANSDFQILLKNVDDGDNSFSGIAFDSGNETDPDSIGAAIRAERDSTAGSNMTLHDMNLTFATNDAGDAGLTERMRITHDGKVGIGSTNPVANLDIIGSLAVSTTVDIGGGVLVFGNQQHASGSVLSSSGTNVPGKNLIFESGASTGNTLGGQIEFKVSPAGGSGTLVNPHVTLLTLPPTGIATFAGSIQVPNNDGIRNGDGETCLTVDADQTVKIQSALRVLGNVIQASDGGTTITMDNSDNVTVSGDITSNSGLLTLGSDADGTDRKIIFGHSTIKTSIGIDDSADVFAINTDVNFEAGNDLEIDTSGNITVGNGDLILGSDLKNTSGQLNIESQTDVLIRLDASDTGSSGDNVQDNNNASFKVQKRGNTTVFEVDEAGLTRVGKSDGSAGSLQIRNSTAVTSINDEDNMSSNSATALATQQSIKSYVDATRPDLQIESAAAYLTLKNTSNEHTDGGAETRIIFTDHSNASLTRIEGMHDGSLNDTKGKIKFWVNNGSGLVDGLTIGSDKAAHFGGSLVVWGNDIASGTDADLTIRSDTHIILKVDADNDGTSLVKFVNGANTEVATVSEDGSLQLDGKIAIGAPAVEQGFLLHQPLAGGSDQYIAEMKNTTAHSQTDILKLTTAFIGDATTANMFTGFFTAAGRMGRIAGDGAGGVTLSDAFTGCHPTVILSSQATEKGLIVESTGEMWAKSDAISTGVDTGIPKVTLTVTAASKKVYGVIANIYTPDHDSPEYGYTGYVNRWGVAEDEAHITVNSLGEGQILVTNINGPVENGDYIVSSEITGLGKKQDDDILRSSTVAKCVENIDWNSITETIEHNGQTYKKCLAACTYHCG
jgi:hypothetical protein